MGNVAVAVLLIIGLVAGDANADRRIEAQQLFDDGKALMAAGRHDEACPKFAASNAIAPSPSTLMNLGACHEAGMRLATAWVTFKEAAALALRVDPVLAEPAQRRADALQPRLSSLRIGVSSASRVSGLVILRNGAVLTEAQWNSPQYVDGGDYEIMARAPSASTWTTRISMANERGRRTVEIPRLAGSKVLGRAAVGPGLPGRTRPVRLLSPQRKVALIASGLGLASLGAGTLLGLRARSYEADSDAICPGTICDDPDGLRLNAQARSTGTKATVFLIGGGVLIAGGGILWLLGRPHPVDVAPMVSGDAIALSLSGTL